MLRKMSWRQLCGWMAFSEIEPFGYQRSDLGFAQVASVIANANRSKNRRPFKVSDFLPKFGKGVKGGKREPVRSASSWSQIKSMARVYAATSGAVEQ